MRKGTLIIVVTVLLEISSLAVGNCDGAGNCYVSIIATGTGTGADWANACTDFTGACDVTSASMRGTTIWVGGSPGNYLGPSYTVKTFSAPDSGTTPITIIGASAENHGTDTGWRRQSATAIVPFTGPITISTDNWIFNGQFRSPGGGDYHDQHFGYHMQVANTTGTANGAIQVSGSHVTLEYIAVFGSNGKYSDEATDNGIYYSPGVTNEYVGYSRISTTGADLISASSGSNFTFEHNLFWRNHQGLSTQASSAINVGDITNLIIRYNHFGDITSTAILTDGHADATAFTPNWYFYGNDIFWTTTLHSAANYGLSAGIVNLVGETLNGGVIQVYNNTIAGVNTAACVSTMPCNSTALNLNGTTGGSCAAHTQNCIGATAPLGTVYNNLWWNPYKASNIAVNLAANPKWTPTGDYGEGICATTGCTNSGSLTVVGANDTTANTGNPFVSFNAVMGSPVWYNFNFQLTADTASGVSIPGWSTTPSGCTSGINCEDTDPLSITRGSHGTIDRGAFQRAARALLTVGTTNTAFGVHVGQTFQQTPVCTWSSAPTRDACPDGAAPFIKRWASLDKTVATVDSTGLVTGVSPHNAFLRLYYGGMSSKNNTVVVVTDGLGAEPLATLPTGIVRTGSPLAFSGYDTTAFDANFPTTYSLPTGGKTWTPLTSTDFIKALKDSAPGDVIILQAGTTYSTNGAFTMPAKSNPSHKWIYIISSNMAQLPAQGTRVSPNDAVNMPKLVETGGSGLMIADVSADHWWLAGLELIGAATGGTHPASGSMVNTNAPNPATATALMPDSITVDRCYLHAASGSDMRHTIVLNASHFAVLDSYIGPGLAYQTQANGGASYFSPGPYKIINNFFSAFGQDLILGGAGGFSNMWVTRDVYISHNLFWNDPEWRVVGLTVYPHITYGIANNFELKICQRCLIDGNVIQNSWASAQGGANVVFNTGTGVNGPDALISDITFSNNIMSGALQGVFPTEFAANNNGCDAASSPCQYPGEARRINVFNNLYVMGNQGPPGGRKAIGSNAIAASVPRLMTDVVWQHNTFVGPYLTDHVYCDRAFYFNPITGGNGPTDNPPSINMWILDNVACRQTSGAGPLQGTDFLNSFMGDPAVVPVGTRYFGNVMQVFPARGDRVQKWPTGNVATTNDFTYVDPATGNYQLVSPVQKGSDGQQSGINYSVLMAHQAAPVGTLTIGGTISGAIISGVSASITGAATGTVFADASGNYSFTGLAAGSYTVTPFAPGYAFSPTSTPITLTTARPTRANFTSATGTASIYTVSGKVTADGVGKSGVIITLAGGAGTVGVSTTTDNSGNWSLSVGNGTYTVTPTLAGHQFTPANRSVTVNNADSPGNNFTAATR